VTALHAVPDLPDADLDALEQAVEQGLTAAVASLTRLRELHAHTRRGFEHWHSYVIATFGDLLRLLRLPDEERVALVQSMSGATAEHPKGMPVREQAKLLGVAPGTVQSDRRALGLVVVKDRPEPLPTPTGRVWEQAAEWLKRAGDRGLTRVELADRTGWRDGKCGGALDYTVDKGVGAKTDQWRDAQRVFVWVEPTA
jgi:hypothetical protein